MTSVSPDSFSTVETALGSAPWSPEAEQAVLGGIMLAVRDGEADTVREVLDYVQFKSSDLLEQYRKDVELALREGKIGYEESGRLLKFYEEGLHGYTYLENVRDER